MKFIEVLPDVGLTYPFVNIRPGIGVTTGLGVGFEGGLVVKLGGGDT